jgi:HD superfamily phosphodiesterase
LDFLYTDKAKEIAKERKVFTEQFLERLEKEINGEM